MENKYLLHSKQYLEELCRVRSVQEERAKELEKFGGIFLERKMSRIGNWHYGVRKNKTQKYTYLGSAADETVNSIKELRYLKLSLDLINNNIRILEGTIPKIKSTDYDAVNELLPKTYRNPRISSSFVGNKRDVKEEWKKSAEEVKAKHDVYKPEDLIHRTDDGTYVRSKSEALIYNYLLSVGVAFAYEMPLKLGIKTVYPDFTILSEVDYNSVIVIEHQGMMNNDYYRNRFNEKLYNYLQHGYVQGINIFYTFDHLNGGFDKTPVEDIVRCKIKPDIAS